MKVYDYSNKSVEVELPAQKIKAIFVSVLSGDETGLVLFEDGTTFAFDSSDSRIINFNDGSYVVPENLIDEWMEWEPKREKGTFSYDRQEWFFEKMEALKDGSTTD